MAVAGDVGELEDESPGEAKNCIDTTNPPAPVEAIT
jgi:hypothetical protein